MSADAAITHGKALINVVSTNVTLIPLPPYSPELNGIENLWHDLRTHCWSNRSYEGDDELFDVASSLGTNTASTPTSSNPSAPKATSPHAANVWEPDETTSGERTARQDHPSDDDMSGPVIAPSRLSAPTTPRQRWIAWSATAGLMLVLFVADRLIASTTPKFLQPRQVREQLAALHWFFGTGPWDSWECWLLWLAALVILSFASGWLTRKLTR